MVNMKWTQKNPMQSSNQYTQQEKMRKSMPKMKDSLVHLTCMICTKTFLALGNPSQKVLKNFLNLANSVLGCDGERKLPSKVHKALKAFLEVCNSLQVDFYMPC